MKVALEEILSSLHVIELPMRTRFRGIEKRETALISGSRGWGEFAPFIEYDEFESVPWLTSAIEQAFGQMPEIVRRSIPVNGTIPATDSEAVIENLVASYPGVGVFKIKVGSGLQEDLVRIARVRALVPKAKIRLDVNGSWSVKDAVFNIQTIYGEVTGNSLEYVEQPVASLHELRELKESLTVEVKIAGDEVLRKSKDPFALNLEGAIDVLMLKVAPLGGIQRSLELAEHHKIPVVVSSALESAVGISHGLMLAATLPQLDYACGLATGSLFGSDVGTHEIINGELKVQTITPERIEDFKVSQERLEWWRERITRVWQVMQ